MARSLAELEKRYAKSGMAMSGPGGRGPGGPGGPGGPRGRRGGPRATGKPKNTAGTVKRLASYLAKYKLHLIFALIFMLINTVTSLVGAYLLAPIIDKLWLAVKPDYEVNMSAAERLADSLISRFAGNSTLSYVLAGILVLGCVYLIGIAASYLQSRLMLKVTQGALKTIREELFNKLSDLPVRFFDSETTGDIMSRFTNDVDNIGIMLDNSLVSLISGVITLIGTLVFMITTNITLTMVTIAFVPIYMFGGGAIAKRSSKYYRGQQTSLGAVNGYIEETVTGQKVVKVFNHEAECEEEFSLINDDLRDKQFKAQFYGGVMGPIMHNTSQISYAVTLGVGGILMATRGLSPGALTVFAGYSRQFSMPINMISQQMSNVFSALAGAERVFKVMDTAPEEKNKSGRKMENVSGLVELKDVSFGYLPDKTVLKNITVTAKPGQKIAFVGSTGAGKTTITNLLNRFYDIEQGEILIDSVPVKEYSMDSLRENIAMVLQNTHLFTGTVMENIRYGRLDATDEEVIAAAKTASAHSFIMRLSDGYNTMIEGDGANLSQGQRQLLNIARAAVSKAPILVLDEATSSVDTRTERHIEHGMDRLMASRTTFVIAHRLSTVRNSALIIVLEHGEIVEQGTHDELLALGGRYYELYTGKKELD